MTENTVTLPQNRGMTASALKYIAIAAMLIDHIAYAFVPEDTPLCVLMHFIGRLTAPIMCFFIAEGYHYARSVKKYALRLAIFALISQLPFQFFFTMKEENPVYWPPELNMIFSLLCGLLALWAWHEIDNILLRFLALFGLCLATLFADWPVFTVLFVLTFGIYRENRKKQLIAFAAVAGLMLCYMLTLTLVFSNTPRMWLTNLYHLGVFGVIPLLLFYNGRRGGGRGSKWVFYIFYPAHIAVLALIYLLMMR